MAISCAPAPFPCALALLLASFHAFTTLPPHTHMRCQYTSPWHASKLAQQLERAERQKGCAEERLEVGHLKVSAFVPPSYTHSSLDAPYTPPQCVFHLVLRMPLRLGPHFLESGDLPGNPHAIRHLHTTCQRQCISRALSNS